jgi:hypothetical protein
MWVVGGRRHISKKNFKSDARACLCTGRTDSVLGE